MIGKILIVDDVSSNRIVFKVKLTAAGYQTLTTADGEVALRLALVERPDIIVLNLSLGMDTLKALKAHPQTRRIPVIVVATQAQAALRPEYPPAQPVPERSGWEIYQQPESFRPPAAAPSLSACR